jgi:hypothetical protein
LRYLHAGAEHDEELEEIIRFPQSNGEDIQPTTYTANGDRSAIERRRNGELLMRVTFEMGGSHPGS